LKQSNGYSVAPVHWEFISMRAVCMHECFHCRLEQPIRDVMSSCASLSAPLKWICQLQSRRNQQCLVGHSHQNTLRFYSLVRIFNVEAPQISECIKPSFIYFFLWWRAPQQMLRTHRSLKASCATLVMKMKRKIIIFSFLQIMKHRWDEIDRGKPKYSGESLSQCHFVHHNSHMDWRGIETWPPRLEAGD
jgi:hypothetical protein